MFKCKLVSCKFNGNDSKCIRKDFEKCNYFKYAATDNCHVCQIECDNCDLHGIETSERVERCSTCWERYIKNNNQDEDIEL